MGHDVVQLAGDPGPFALRGLGGLPVKFCLGAVGPALCGPDAGPLGPAEHPRRRGREEDRHLEDGVVRLGVSGRGLRDSDARRYEHAGDPAPDGTAAIDDGVERDCGPQRERREAEADLVVGDPRGPDDQADPDGPGPAPGERDALGGDERQGQPQRVQLGPVRQQRDHVDRSHGDAEAQVLHQLLAPRRERGQPRRQRLREPGQPRCHRLHAPMVRPGWRPGDPPEGGSGHCDLRRSLGRFPTMHCDGGPSREFARAPDAPGAPASSR